MCGISGLVDRSGGARPHTLTALHRAQVHRGPDGDGWLAWVPGRPVRRGRFPATGGPATVLLGHERLAVIDLSDAAHQPMSSPDGRWHLVYNGELYNYRELRDELADRWVFRSNGDTEVLLAAWARWGERCLERFTGMFAFALLDTAEQRLWLARDPFGVKPLFVIGEGDRLAFASELTALVDAGLTGRRIAARPLYDFLHGGLVDHEPDTMVEGVQRLPPATVASFPLSPAGGGLRPRRFWELPARRNPRPAATVVDAVGRAFRRSVELHLRSDVPVGTALSGGIDSSAIICTMRQVLGPHAEIHAFSYLADDPRIDESRWVRTAARAAGAVVHEVRIRPEELVAELDDLVRSQGEPFGSTRIYAQRRVFRAAAGAGVTVLLDGQGADELFGGYRSYLAGVFTGMVRSGKLLNAARFAAAVARLPDVRLGRHELARVADRLLPAHVARRLPGGAVLDPFPTGLDAAWFADRGVAGPVEAAPTDLDHALERAFTRTSLPSLLRFEDRNSMRWSRESRVPFLEPDLVATVFTAPPEAVVGPDATTKWALRQALRGVVPDAILDRRDKIGFTTPEDRWLDTLAPWVDGVLRSDAARRVGGLDLAACEREWAAIRAGRARFDQRVWRWVNTIRWAETLDLEG